MHTQTRFPQIDTKILKYIEKHPTDFATDQTEWVKVGILYSGFLYREITCESHYEFNILCEFLRGLPEINPVLCTPIYRSLGFIAVFEIMID